MATKKKTKRKPPIRYRTITFDDEKFRIAVVDKGNDIPVQHKIVIAELVCRMYESDLYKLGECLEKCGIKSDSTWYKWLDEIKEIEVLYSTAQTNKDRRYRHKLKFRARTQLERLIDGYTVKTTEREAEPVNIADEGKTPVIQMRTTKVKEKETIIRPSAKLIETVLFNVDGKNFTKSPEPYKAGNDEQITDITVTIKGGSMPPVTSEDDIKTDI